MFTSVPQYDVLDHHYLLRATLTGTIQIKGKSFY